MPLEGHWERQNAPLARITLRENRLVSIVAALTVAGAIAVTVLALAAGPAQVGRGCLLLTTGSTTGSVTLRPCGAEAVAFCRRQAVLRGPLALAAHTQCHARRIAGF